MAHRRIQQALDDGATEVVLRRCLGSSHLALLLARLVHARIERASGPTLVVTADEEAARELTRDLRFFLGEPDEGGGPMQLPDVETSPYADISADRGAIQGRMGVLHRLVESASRPVDAPRRPLLLVASAAALRRKVIPRATFAGLCQTLRPEVEVDRDALAEALVAAGYQRERIVEDPGTFALRGGLVDVFPPLQTFPARVELFGDLVESIRLFDPASQRTLRPVERLELHPVHEAVRAPGFEPRARILAAADAVNFPSRATKALLEEVQSGRSFFGIEALVPAFHEHGLVAIDDYLAASGGLRVVVDPHGVAAALSAEDERAEAGYRARLESGRLSYPPGELFATAEELSALLEQDRRLVVPLRESAEATADGAPASTVSVEAEAEDQALLVGELKRARSERGEEILGALAQRVRAWIADGLQVVLAAGSPAQADRLDALLRPHDLRATIHREGGAAHLLEGDRAAGEPALHLQGAELSAGLRAGALVLVAEQEIFGPKARRRPDRRAAGAALTDLRDLQAGQPVVHSLHGIGTYQGLVTLEVVDGVPADFLHLEYAGGDRLYLPIYRMDQVQRYVGAGDAAPKLDRIGGVTWQKKRRRVEGEVRKFSEDLLQLYAQRAALAGHAFEPPDAVYREFEAGFPFTETDDQQQAVDDVVVDLTAPRPMDRLVCGDVGFGKTEVALRAAFLAAMGGKQVAVLAPTTVLVEQHLRTFAERMSPYPIVVESLSRFRKPKDAQRVLEGLAVGTVDVVVGTHRLLSKDVMFRDLGLLVIDEEQRFGVAHKEKLKRLRTQVDILTMTATPIPRTLQMSMIGLREISIIATPPADRLAVRTFVSRASDDALIREAMLKELDRGGQVFYVHNRVETIDQQAARVAELVPTARVVVGHGQLDARRLERVMVDFVSGRHDVLVCTTIIESGLDIPRANTMIVNRADRFGLAQLYQLRGRIGRSRHRAFCYLLVPGIEALSGDARARLAALERFTQLGSGMSVATHDLELRGAGDLLGARQSGQIAAVGFETYARILEEAVAELKGQPIHRESDPEINVNVPAFIPDDYVEDTGQRLELYQRLSSAARDADRVGELLAEIADRYGPRPDEVDDLGALMVVKGLAAKLAARQLDLSGARLALTLDEQTPLDPGRVTELVSDPRTGFSLTPPQRGKDGAIRVRLVRELGELGAGDPLGAARQALQQLLQHAVEG